jgi:thiol:disulfide interchange protein
MTLGMRRVWQGGIVLLAIVAGFWWKSQGPAPSFAGGGWLTDWDAGVQQSRTTGKPALVLFTADWCPACQQFESEVLSRDDVREYLKERHTLVVIDLSRRGGPNDELARQCGVEGIPTLIQYGPTGREIARTYGMGPGELLAWLHSEGRMTQLRPGR